MTGSELVDLHDKNIILYDTYVEGVIDATIDRRICMISVSKKQYTKNIFKWLKNHANEPRYSAVEIIRSAAMDLYPCGYLK